MKKTTILLAAMAMVFGLTESALAHEFETLDVDIPGVTNTYARAINDSGDVAGYYTDSSFFTHGFVYNGTAYIPLDAPGAVTTHAQGINDSGSVVGYYLDSNFVRHGFRWEQPYVKSTFMALDVDIPGVTETRAFGINDSGDIVGYYSDGSGLHGFFYDGNYFTLDYPGAYQTYAYGINDLGHVVGYYGDCTGDHGFFYDRNIVKNDGYITVEVQFKTHTRAWGINDSDVIVGEYNGGGFIYDGIEYTTLDVDIPGVTDTYALGINDSGDIVGYYRDGDFKQSFIAHPEEGDPSFGGEEAPSGPLSAATYDSSGNDGDPVNTFTGELYNQYSPDINLGGPIPLYFGRYYASGLLSANNSGRLGDNWRHHFEWTLTNTGSAITIVNHMGRLIEFTQDDSAWDLTGKTDIVYQLAENAGVFTLLDPSSRLLNTFNGSGQLTGIEDGKGNGHILTYNGDDLATVSDGLGRTLTFTYSDGKLSAVSDGIRTVGFSHTGNNLTQVTDALNDITTYAYEAGSQMIAFTLPEDNIPYSQTWNDSQVVSQTDSDGNTTSFDYAALDTWPKLKKWKPSRWLSSAWSRNGNRSRRYWCPSWSRSGNQNRRYES